jgi:hypothetical protein
VDVLGDEMKDDIAIQNLILKTARSARRSRILSRTIDRAQAHRRRSDGCSCSGRYLLSSDKSSATARRARDSHAGRAISDAPEHRVSPPPS